MEFKEKVNPSRSKFSERMNVLFRRGPKLDEEFWEDLEEALILSDIGVQATMELIERLRDQAMRQALPDAYAVLDLLAEEIGGLFAEADPDPFHMNPVCILFVGINGAGKTTTVGKLANQATVGGRKVLIGSADTFRAAAIEQLDVWGERSGVEVVKRERGADPASVCYDVIDRAEKLGSDLVLIDTSGRLHTSDELMRELQKIVNVTRKRANIDVKTVLVIDATTGQNGLQQAREFDKALDLDGVIMTKLDGTAKGGIAVAVSHELDLPVLRVGVGEGITDLQPFDPLEYAEALFGEVREAVGKPPELGPSYADVTDKHADLTDDEFFALFAVKSDDASAEAEIESVEDEDVAVIEEPEETEIEDSVSTEEEVAESTMELEGDDTVDADAEVMVEDIVAGDEEDPRESDDGVVDEGAFEDDGEEEFVDIVLEAERESIREKMRRWFS